MRLLRLAAAAEPITLLLLLGNLATVHVPAVASAVGPLHGSVYLMVIVAVAMRPDTPAAARWWALVPGIGGLLALRRLRMPVGSGLFGRWSPRREGS